MAATCPLASCCRPSREGRCTYDHVARDPGGDFHYHRGPRYAADYLRYDADELASLPKARTALRRRRQSAAHRADPSGRDGPRPRVRRRHGRATRSAPRRRGAATPSAST